MFLLMNAGNPVGYSSESITDVPKGYTVVEVPEFKGFVKAHAVHWKQGLGTKSFEMISHSNNVQIIRHSKDCITVVGPDGREAQEALDRILQHKRKK